jgi:hypothetical protein
VNIKQLWSIFRGRQTNFSCLNASWTYYPDGDPIGKKRETVTIYVPDGYKDAKEFLKDCQFERAPVTNGDRK